MRRARVHVAFALVTLFCTHAAEAQCPPDELDCGDGSCCPDGAICCGDGDCEFDQCSTSVGPTGGDTGSTGSSGVGGDSSSSGSGNPSCPVDCGDGTCCSDSFPVCCAGGTCAMSADGCVDVPDPNCVIDCGSGICCPGSASFCCPDGTCSSSAQCGLSIELVCPPGYPVQCSDHVSCCPASAPVCCPPFCGTSEGTCGEPSFHIKCAPDHPYLCDDDLCWTEPCNSGTKGGSVKDGTLPLDTTWTEDPADCSTRGAGGSGGPSLLCAVAMTMAIGARRRRKTRVSSSN